LILTASAVEKRFFLHWVGIFGSNRRPFSNNGQFQTTVLTEGGAIMNVSEAIRNFMEYQKMNSGKKYGQKLSAVS
jgi:hypothetical protein